MKRLFIYRLFLYSKSGFCLILIFVCCYAVLFYKKMDMLMFPYNDMFSHRVTGNYSSSTFAVKLNGVLVKVTDKLYWKKDFLEESLHNYSLYKKDHDTLFLTKFLPLKIRDHSRRAFFSSRLVPETAATSHWLHWYVRFAGIKARPGTLVELFQYDFIFENNRAVVKDSTLIYKTHLF